MHIKNNRFYESPFHNDRRSEIEKIVGEKKLEEKDNTVQLRNLKIGIDKLKSYGFSASELKDGGFSASELKDGGFSAKELKDAGYTITEL